jgi:hypothetical protein
MNKNGKPGHRSRRPVQSAPERRLLHDLSNTIGALRLRVDLVTKDSTCMWAQGSNLEAIARIVDEARALVMKLEDQAQPLTARRRTPP